MKRYNKPRPRLQCVSLDFVQRFKKEFRGIVVEETNYDLSYSLSLWGWVPYPCNIGERRVHKESIYYHLYVDHPELDKLKIYLQQEEWEKVRERIQIFGKEVCKKLIEEVKQVY